MQKQYEISTQTAVPFKNNMDYCIGTGRMGLALHKEYLDQLKLVQDEIGFSHIRGHGLFCDDMAIYQEYTDADGRVHPEYNFTYLDRVFDSYTELGLRPFIELGFMPEKLASGSQTIFYWKGNTTPPKDYAAWCGLIKATLSHLIDRYGRDEVVRWPVEVWNEPNLPGFWENADMDEYFRLFDESFAAVKEVDLRFRVGGPAVCGGSDEKWILAFLEHCREKKITPDFITRHHYNTEFPKNDGHYGYAKLTPPEAGYANLQTTRDIINRFPEFKGLEIHITEFNTSYIPNCSLHDTNLNAAYLAHQLSRLGDENASYSYWTFGDVFEERGVPFTPFHGGFGLVANGCIPKPTFWTFSFFKQLDGECLLRSEEAVIVRRADGSLCGTAWNLQQDSGEDLKLSLTAAAEDGKYTLITRTVDEQVCNPQKLWFDMGEPQSLTRAQLKLLREAANPLTESSQLVCEGGRVTAELELKPNAVVYFELRRIAPTANRGFHYDYEATAG